LNSIDKHPVAEDIADAKQDRLEPFKSVCNAVFGMQKIDELRNVQIILDSNDISEESFYALRANLF